MSVELQLPNDEREIVHAVHTPVNEDGDVLLFMLVNRLKQMGYPLENAFVSYHSPEIGVYINCGHDPLPKTVLSQDGQIMKDEQCETRVGGII